MHQRSPHERRAWAEVGHTAVRPAVARLLTAACLALLLAVPVVQLGEPGGEATPTPFEDFFAGLSEVARTARRDGLLAANRALLERMTNFEDALERRSWLLERALPPSQWLLTRWGGAGNERVVVGDGGWLIYRPGLDYLTGRPFLDPVTLARRRAAAPSWRAPPQPDPRPAILDLARQLEARGVGLVVLPVPTKAMIYPDALAPALAALDEPLHNPSFAAFRAELEQAGIAVVDPAPALLAARRRGGDDVFLRTDSHWSPAGVAVAARLLAQHVLPRLPPAAAAGWRRQGVEHRALGDLARMLELPPWQELYAPETVVLQRVAGGDGRPWSPSPSSPVLLLGDSFTNVFSRPDLGWGTGAGLAEQLAFHLQRPIDRLAVNDGSASGTRRRLAQLLAQGDDRLAGKVLVIYQLAVRELAQGDWQLVRLPEPARVPPPAGAAFRARGTVVAAARLPPPGTTPYRDAILALHLRDVEAPPEAGAGGEILVYAWGMRDDQPAPASRYRPGQRLELELVPWSAAAAELEPYQRLELAGEASFLLDAYWAEEHHAID
ncbi:MAG: hypothetical protein D6696_00845 [Acidobacteria bacterium]|nr:MAG: hypothetical protein D6696_00845 [Acidobacteriota bacterium]